MPQPKYLALVCDSTYLFALTGDDSESYLHKIAKAMYDESDNKYTDFKIFLLRNTPDHVSNWLYSIVTSGYEEKERAKAWNFVRLSGIRLQELWHYCPEDNEEVEED
ncbi:hypothetical protein COV24_02230 [candidate division WWE3 bacterium CG10_big_fil_rev_8_21_14_0_10_32_10]|uniref:Uncharacterized protein n=1 Tax=candidate division WWE3 bacterium CG10_big_fil_rev_8_21_14_0_10_32_10 TaxID=1975090 RepID=A0A2H0RAI6_UNCKA|nr:MAG: hypothetical protein COV24_02230 [candidate division WWE3 bacterium CG10_big_fil_rev_8_21_14_0_10_32_10]